MAKYPIPQFIEEEGKIVFFLTFRQFFLLIGGGVICFLLFLVLPFWLFIVLLILVMGLASVIAFVKINNMSVIKALFHYIWFLMGRKNYIWKKEDKK